MHSTSSHATSERIVQGTEFPNSRAKSQRDHPFPALSRHFRGTMTLSGGSTLTLELGCKVRVPRLYSEDTFKGSYIF